MAVNIGPKIGIDGEAEFRKEINGLIQQQKTLASEMKAVTSSFDKNDKSQAAVTAQAGVLNKQVAKQSQLIGELQTALSASVKKYGEADTKTQKWQQSVNEATAELNRMKSQLSDLENGVDDVGDAMDDAGKKTLSFSDVVGAGALVEGVKAAVSALGDVVDSTTEYRNIMASLETSSQAAGYTTAQTSDTLRQLYGVLGDTQAAATATANLQAVGLSQGELTQLTDAAIGAWAKYGDSIPIDSLAEAINETIKTGTVTSTFADVLNWAGQSEDEFNEKLAAAGTEAGRANAVMQAMASQGLLQAGEAWRQNNQDIVAANEAQLSFSDNMASIAGQISPLATALKGTLSAALGGVSDAIKAIDFGGIVNGTVSMQALSGQISEALSGIASMIASNAPAILQTGAQIVASIGMGIVQAAPQALTAAKGLIDNFTAGITQNLPSLIASGAESLVGFTAGLKENIGALVDSGLEMVKALASGIVESLPALIESVPLIVSNIANIINENAPKMLATGAEIIGKLVAGLIANIPVILANLPQIIGAIVDTITAINWINLGASIIKGVATGIKNLAASLKDSMGSTFKKAVQAAIDAIKSLPSMAIQWGKDFIQGLIDGIRSMIGKVGDAVASIADTITSWLHFSRPDVGPLRQYETWMPDMMAGMARGIRQNAWQLEDALNAATSHMAPMTVQTQAGTGGGVNMGGVTIQINAPEGMDINALADAVAYRLQTLTARKEAMW